MLLALVDCNNFFVSCERVFNPKLIGKPVVVLSSNDGCIVARSNEAKRLGIPMGAPAFQYDALFKKHSVTLFSSNFPLYLDMSRRIMRLLSASAPVVQVYSVDEAFLSFDGIADPVSHAREIKEKIAKWTGVPVSIGIAATKVLTKVAGYYAKKEGGICMISPANQKMRLEAVPVEEIWGIGAKLAERLRAKGIYTAWQLQAMPDDWLKKELSVVGLKTAWELRGISCFDLVDDVISKKSISTAKSFGYKVETFEELSMLLVGYVDEVAKDLREQESIASFLVVSLPDIQREAYCPLNEPTLYTPTLVNQAKRALEKIFIPGVSYKKVGVTLGGLISKNIRQTDLFSSQVVLDKQERLMDVYDTLNKRFGKNSIRFASKKERLARAGKRTPCYTTRWDEIPIVYAS
jgi:DNA polymerase V